MQSVPHYDGSRNDFRWVKIEGCKYQLTKEEIKMEVDEPPPEPIVVDAHKVLTKIC